MDGRQLDIFDEAAPQPTSCGACVHRNAFEAEDTGDCPYKGPRHRSDAACDEWFPMIELRKALYGGSAKVARGARR